jgi:hypothetical protein
MDQKPLPILCYIGSYINPEIDPYLEANGFCHGLILFSVPELGLLFRCRADGELIDLEFGSFFSLLRFLKQYLADDTIKRLRVLSSNPEFVFSFKPESKHLAKGSTREKLLKVYAKEYTLEIGYIEPRKNRCYLSPGEYPSMPENSAPILKPTVKNDTKIDCKPFQRGIRL